MAGNRVRGGRAEVDEPGRAQRQIERGERLGEGAPGSLLGPTTWGHRANVERLSPPADSLPIAKGRAAPPRRYAPPMGESVAEPVYVVCWGRDRREIEAYLYGGNEILVEYERPSPSSPYVAILRCQGGGGFGAESQAARLASGLHAAGGPQTLDEAERSVLETLGASPRLGDEVRPGHLSRPSGISEPELG